MEKEITCPDCDCLITHYPEQCGDVEQYECHNCEECFIAGTIQFEQLMQEAV